MNTKTQLILTSLFLVFAFSCDSEDKSSQKIIISKSLNTIDLVQNFENAKSNKKFKDFFEIESIIKLESNEKSFISSVGKILSIKDSILILDDKYTGIRVFDKMGNYLYTISSVGQGPGQFTKLFDMNYAIDKDLLFVYSNDDMKMATFKRSGEFISEKHIPFYAHYFAPVSDNRFLFYLNYNSSEINDEHNLILTDSDYKVKKYFFPYKRNFALSMSGFLLKLPQSVLYADAFSENVYEYSNEEINLKYKFNLGKYLIPSEFTNEQSTLIKKLMGYSYLLRVGGDSEKIMFFSFVHQRNVSNGFFLKNNNQVFTAMDFTKSDLFHLLSATSNITDNDNSFIAYIDAEMVRYKTNANKDMFQTLKKDYPKIFEAISKLKDTDNPVIITFKMK
jgi:6-bladed beta-propeller